MAEGVYLLKIPRPMAPPGDLNNSTGPDAVELSPDQITALIEKDPVEWNARIEALRNVGLEVLDIVKRRDAKELWDANEDLDTACEACHRRYWYPGETPEFYERSIAVCVNSGRPRHRDRRGPDADASYLLRVKDQEHHKPLQMTDLYCAAKLACPKVGSPGRH